MTKIELKINSKSHHLSLSSCGSTRPIHISTTFLQHSSRHTCMELQLHEKYSTSKVPPHSPKQERNKADSRLITVKKELY
jgi:hypothetical protein